MVSAHHLNTFKVVFENYVQQMVRNHHSHKMKDGAGKLLHMQWWLFTTWAWWWKTRTNKWWTITILTQSRMVLKNHLGKMVNVHYYKMVVINYNWQMVNSHHIWYEDGAPSPFTLIKNGLLAPLWLQKHLEHLKSQSIYIQKNMEQLHSHPWRCPKDWETFSWPLKCWVNVLIGYNTLISLYVRHSNYHIYLLPPPPPPPIIWKYNRSLKAVLDKW